MRPLKGNEQKGRKKGVAKNKVERLLLRENHKHSYASVSIRMRDNDALFLVHQFFVFVFFFFVIKLEQIFAQDSGKESDGKL